jgi:hypothetical protein
MEPLEAACPCRFTSAAPALPRNASTSCVETIRLTSLLGRQRLHNCATIWCVSFQTIHRCDSPRMLGRSTGRGYGAGGVDRRICQTFAASPAEPGELPCWFRACLACTPRVLLCALRTRRNETGSCDIGSREGLQARPSRIWARVSAIISPTGKRCGVHEHGARPLCDDQERANLIRRSHLPHPGGWDCPEGGRRSHPDERRPPAAAATSQPMGWSTPLPPSRPAPTTSRARIMAMASIRSAQGGRSFTRSSQSLTGCLANAPVRTTSGPFASASSRARLVDDEDRGLVVACR